MKKIRKYLHQSENESFAKRLAAYSAAVTGAIAIAPEAQAQVAYFPQPVATVYQTGHANAGGLAAQFDIDGDAVTDITFYVHTAKVVQAPLTTYYGALIALVPTGNAIAGNFYSTTQGNSPTPYALNLGDTIGKSGQNFTYSPYGAASSDQQTLGVFEYQTSTGGGSGSVGIGNWVNADSKFLGLYFLAGDGKMHYGWMRMTTHVVSDTASITFIEGFAYDTIPNQPIVVGYTGVADSATNIVAADVANHNNGSDLHVSFQQAGYEYTISDYRIIVVKSSAADSFNLAKANTASAANYTTVKPNGSASYGTVLSTTALDADGDAIHNGVPYTVFVLNVVDSVYGTANSLSGPSNSVTLVNAADTVSNIVGTDIGNADNGSDLQVTFNKATDETSIGSYRVIVVRDTALANFNLNAANAISAANYTLVPKTGSNLTTVLSSTAKDASGIPIQNNVPYSIFVLDVADGTNAQFNSLSGPSSSITLTTPVPADTAGNIVGTDIGNNDNGTDLQVSFNKAANENTIGSYRIIVVPSDSSSAFTLSKADLVTFSNYTSVQPTGSNISQALAAGAKDVEGNPIHDSVAYSIFVLNVADGTNATVNTLSGPSASITLTPAAIVTADSATDILGINLEEHPNGSDLLVNFNQAANEKTISAYRIMVVPAKGDSTFNLSVANTVPAGNYKQVNKNGGGTYSTQLDTNANDVNGKPITNNVAYAIFVLNVADGTVATVNSLSGPSPVVTLTDTLTGITTVNNLENVDVYSYASDIYVHFHTANQSNAIMQVYNDLGQQVYSKELNGDQKISLNTAEGIYAVSLTQNGKMLRKLLYISAQ